MQRRHQLRLLLAVAVAMIAAAVWFGGQAQRDAGDRGANTVDAAQDMLIARLDVETGLRGFLLSGREEFLQPYYSGVGRYHAALRKLRSFDDLGPRSSNLLSREEALTRRWLAEARTAIAARRDGKAPSTAWLNASKQGMDRFRDLNSRLVARTEDHRDSLEESAERTLLLIIAGLVLLTAIAGYLMIERPSRRRAQQRLEEDEFAETLQFAAGESEAQELLGKELNRAIDDGLAVVFSRNNSENRLETATRLSADSSLAARIPTAAPSDCLAVRRGRPFERRAGEAPLVECELCGLTGANSICLPSLVGGEVIGSVLVSRDAKPLGRAEHSRLEAAVASAAPVLANLRNLEIAETRAVTDSLTGLANARAAAQDLDRMAAFAMRTGTPLTAIMLDLDHFKRVNDSYGHQMGDEVLAALGGVLRKGARSSDFVARYGGEEFLVLLQDTDAAAGVEVAEKLREAVRQMGVPGLVGRLSASFGVAAVPAHASDADALLRAADRALYIAKKGGRDQVRVAAESEAEAILQEAGLEG